MIKSTRGKRTFIVGSDWWDDCDDVVAMRIFARAHKQGVIDLAGVCINACMDISAASLSAFLMSENCDPIIGIDFKATYLGGNILYQPNLAKLPHKYNSNSECMDGVKMYRTILANSDGNVNIVEIGFQQVLSELLDSEADDISPLSGYELIKEKVEKIWLMAGKWDEENGKENNVVRSDASIKGAHNVSERWPTEITYLGFEVGKTVITGGELSNEDILHKVLEDYGFPNGRSSWDPMTALLACIGDEEAAGYDKVRGKAVINKETGENKFIKDEKGKHCYVVKKYSDDYYAAEINKLIK